MPVRKFRNLQDMEDSSWRSPDDPSLFRVIEETWNFSHSLCPQQFPPGVYRHRSVEEAQELREAWEQENFQRFVARRGMESESAPSTDRTP
jgi:hypothetical protein